MLCMQGQYESANDSVSDSQIEEASLLNLMYVGLGRGMWIMVKEALCNARV